MMSFKRRGSQSRRGKLHCVPSTESFMVATRMFKFRLLTGSLYEAPKSPILASIGVWSPETNDYISPPMNVKLDIDGCTMYFADILSFVLDEGPRLRNAQLSVEVTERRVLRPKFIGSFKIPFDEFSSSMQDIQDEDTSDKWMEMGISPNAVSLTGTLIKPGGKKSASNRGTMIFQVELLPLTFAVDLQTFFKELPHNICNWVVMMATPEDYQLKTKDAGNATPRSNIERFRSCAVRMLSQGITGFKFGEASYADLNKIRKGTKSALRIGEGGGASTCGEIVAINGNQNISFSTTDIYEHRLSSFLNQFKSSSASIAWTAACEVLGQLNPSVMVDLDLDTTDFGKLSSLGTLFRIVSEQLLHGSREKRVDALRELAREAPQALCSIALHVPYDILVKELNGVIYDSDSSDLFISDTNSVDHSTAKKMVSVKERSWHGSSTVIHISGEADPSKLAGNEAEKSAFKRVLKKAGQLMSLPKNMSRQNLCVMDDDFSIGLEGSFKESAVLDRTWHGTKITKEQMQSGSYEYSEVPRHGALRLSNTQYSEPLDLVPKHGMLDALQLLSGVLGREFIENFTMPCIQHPDVDQVKLAQLLGQLHYSASNSGCDVASEIRAMHLDLLSSNEDPQIKLSAIKSIPDFARHESEEVIAHVERCCVILAEEITANGSSDKNTFEDAFIFAIPSLFRQADEDIVHSEIGVPGGASLSHQVLHLKTLQGISKHCVTKKMLNAVCTIMEHAIKNREKMERRNSCRRTSSSLNLSADEWSLQSGLWHVSSAERLSKGKKKTIEERYMEAALAVFRGGEMHDWSHAARPWKAMIECLIFHVYLCGFLPSLCRLLINLRGEAKTAALEAFHPVIQDILEVCSSMPGDVKENFLNPAIVCAWSWNDQRTSNLSVKLHCQLPIILSVIPSTWERRLCWLRAMQASYSAYLAQRHVELPDGVWKVSEDGSYITVKDGMKMVFGPPITDPIALAYQFPAALRLCKEAGVAWAEALVVYKCMCEDDESDVRWMMSHSIHLYPNLFDEDCLSVLCETFEKLLRDEDLDVAEGIHKHYMEFVRVVNNYDRERAVFLANLFLDQGLWERRLHFAVFQSEQLVQYVESDLVPDTFEEADAAFRLLLRHSCTTVRKKAAASVIKIAANSRNSMKAPGLLQVLVSLSNGTCREKQTFVWACEYALNDEPQLLNDFLKPALQRVASMKTQKPASRSLIYSSATSILSQLDAKSDVT
uniref:Uncharacterized protein n=1 Tax=Guillardia theta TaxID=55529 RepID=A0A7S4K7H8_GUITH|mmetsp:Transcript_21718/g.71847  ORF Transcript_21718/g.71847 Transcript_21718/m.71847 type:complete len:1227 (+) Transcript_21718:73-3753(+)